MRLRLAGANWLLAVVVVTAMSGCLRDSPDAIQPDDETPACKYTLAQVNAWRTTGDSQIFLPGITAWGTTTDAQGCPQILLGIVSDSIRPAAEARLQLLAIPVDAVKFWVTGVFCTLEMRPNIKLSVHDSVTGKPAASGASGSSAGPYGYRNSLIVMGDSLMWDSSYEQAGTFEVRIDKPGYRTWLKKDIVVTRDVCHVNTAFVRALLVPSN